MSLDDLKNHRIGILGFGQEGQAVLKYLADHELSATVYDQKDGDNYLDSISDCTLLFRSPGIWRKHPKILDAEKAGVVITSQTKWFFENSKATIIGVTGTKGKGTTSSLIYEILKASGKKAEQDVFLTGNIGKIQPLEFIDSTNENTIVVYELSSFQLQDLTQSPHVGICLMTTSDHLNHHEHLEEYHGAKAAITAFQTDANTAIYNNDYEASSKIGSAGFGEKLVISAQKQPVSGAFISGDKIIVSNPKAGIENYEIDCTVRKLRGAHNLENIAAASLAGVTMGIDLETISKTVNDFAGLEHRLQFVGEINGVSYYNDSISTVPETTIAALNSFDQPIHLLIGGSDKGLDYSMLVKDISSRSNIASLNFLGEIGAKLKTSFEVNQTSIPLFGSFSNFKESMTSISERAKVGEIVLLSPASASFDMFKNYADRGNQFVALVKNQNE